MLNNISSKLQDNMNAIKNIFKNSSDIIYCEIESYSKVKALIVYIDGLSEKTMINRYVIDPFISNYNHDDVKKCIYNPNLIESNDMSEAINSIIEFQVIMFLEGLDTAYIIDLKSWEKRGIEEPSSEIVIRGPKEGFVESIRLNTSLIRRKIKNTNLVFENFKIGKQTKTDVIITYIDGIVNMEVLKLVKKRLESIDIDSILESGYIEQFIEDSHTSLFATIGNTQKPDVVAAKLLEGRVAILCDGTPHVLTVPYLFIEHIQTSEDYYVRPYMATLFRIVRVLAIFSSIFLPSIYVALQTFHQEMVPTTLLIRMASDREGIPLPSLAEALFMILLFEFLRESGTRIPRPVGSAVSIVGALIIGDAIVKAGIVSSTMVVVISATAVTSFIVYSFKETTMILRLVFLFLAGIMGLYGISCGLFILIAHMVSLKSFGIPYMYPLSPLNKEGLKDFIIKAPLKHLKMRPILIAKKNTRRMK